MREKNLKNTFYVSIGSNINKEENIKKCKKLLKLEFEKILFSKVYETKPVGYQKQEDFLNAICRIESNKSNNEVIIILKQTEKKLKRKKTKIKSGPRTIDLDLIIWNKKNSHTSATQSYNLVGLKEILVKGEAEKSIEKLLKQ